MRREFSKQVCSGRGCERPVIARGLCRRHYQRWYKHNDPEGGRTARGEPLRWLRDHAAYHEGDECLIWPFARNSKGYGKMGSQNASRVMCEIVWGAPPSSLHEAAHSCGKGHLACISPQHVRWATKVENQADRLIHSTASLGSRNPASILTEGQVHIIRRLAEIKTHKEIAEEYEVSRQHISNIVAGKRWGWL